jgi:radical SAM protein with 4Fe4S-binding SPASM domain
MNYITNPDQLPKMMMPPLPEVYQIEITAFCNLSCIMCPTRFFSRSNNKRVIDINLVKKIVEEGDLDASYFVELQMAGEPTLHPQMKEIIDIVKTTKVNVGCSTNGTFLEKQSEALLSLNSITISLDSISDYENIRKGGSRKIISDILAFVPKALDKGIAIDIQVIELEGWQNQLYLIQDVFEGIGVNIRSTPNCYFPYFFPDKYELPVSKELCINPWFSVSIQANGNVTSCCFSMGDDIIYGNLNKQTLREVWAGDEVRKLREEHQTRNYRNICANCYMRSPALFHWDMYLSSVKKRYKGEKYV